MAIKIGFLCFGEGGSNIGEYAAQKGFSVIAINSAKIDLDKLKIIPNECRFHLTGWEGAGRNREIGKEATITHAEEIFEKVNEKFNDCDIVFVVASAAGGTGSGALPVGIEILSSLKSLVGAIVILPSKDESVKAHMNTLECFSELSQYEQLSSVFIIDNEKASAVFQDSDKSQIYQLSNCQLIDNFYEICNLTSQTSLVSNFDKNDLLEILNERGYTMISKVIVNISEVKDSSFVTAVIKNSWRDTCSPDIGQSQIVKSGIFGKVPNEYTSMINIQSIFDETGIPYDNFVAYYQNDEHLNHCVFYTILSGLSFPMERLQSMEEEVRSIEQDLMDKVEVSRTQVFTTNSWGSKFKRDTNTEKKLTLSERLSKFQ